MFFLLGTCLTALAEGIVVDDELLKLDVPEMEPKLVTVENQTYRSELSLDIPTADISLTSDGWKPDFDFFKSKTNPGVKPYKFIDDMSFVGVPLFLAGLAIKGDKAMFRVNNKDGKPNTQLLTDFKTGIDDYTQFFGPVMVVGLKLGGVEGRSDWPRLLASAGLSYAIMAGLVNGIKYSAKEMRPDGSSANSWPSGHTATSFVGATLLHKEYGLTRSPWYSVAGYGVATATGVMRVLNNRHWVSDVMSGAGIGIMSTELGYAIGDLLFKGKGLLRNDLEVNTENPSFFGISMGVGLGGKDIDFDYFADMQDPESHGLDEEMIKEYSHQGADVNIDFRSATVVDAEGAYFFNKYVGVGGRFRVRAMSAKSFGQYADISVADVNDLWNTQFAELYQKGGVTLTPAMYNEGGAPVTEMKGIVKSDHLAEFTGSVGVYFNIPLSSRLSLGTKALIGRSFTQELDIDGYAKGNVKNIPYYMLIQDGLVAKDPEDGSLLFLPEAPESTGETYETEWDYLKLGASSSTAWGTGISLTYRYKSNFSWRLYCDYDYSEKKYTLTYDSSYFLKRAVTSGTLALLSNPEVSPLAGDLTPYVFKKDKKMHYVTIGLSFLVNL
jgi:membrane-associated phospholipid phosphatase